MCVAVDFKVAVTPLNFSLFHNTVADGEPKKGGASAIAFLRSLRMIPLAIKTLF